jgi:hypothetical protein
MPLLQSLTDLLLVSLRKVLEAVERVKILRVTAHFLNRFVEVGDDLRRDASPARASVQYSESASKIGSNLPVSPEEALEIFGVDPGAETELAFADLDLFGFAFFVLAACSAG